MRGFVVYARSYMFMRGFGCLRAGFNTVYARLSYLRVDLSVYARLRLFTRGFIAFMRGLGYLRAEFNHLCAAKLFTSRI